jgi:hypothetical protein
LAGLWVLLAQKVIMTKKKFSQQIGLTGPVTGTFRFVLKANGYGSYLQDVSRLIAILVLLLLVEHSLLLTLTDWGIRKRSIIMLTGLLVITLFGLDHKKSRSRSVSYKLVVEKGTLTLAGDRRVPRTVKQSALRIEWLGWGNDLSRLLPAVRITDPDGLMFSVGLAEGTPVAMTARDALTTTDFLLVSEPAWQELKKALGKQDAQD